MPASSGLADQAHQGGDTRQGTVNQVCGCGGPAVVGLDWCRAHVPIADFWLALNPVMLSDENAEPCGSCCGDAGEEDGCLDCGGTGYIALT